MKLKRQYYFSGITFFVLSFSLQAQSFSIREDRKRSLLQEIRPIQSPLSPSYNDYKLPQSIRSEDLSGTKKNYRPDSVEQLNKYNIDAFKASIKNLDLFKIEPGNEIKTVVSGGKTYLVPVKESDRILDRLSLRNRLQGIMVNTTIGGLNLSGWNKKKLSEKSKNILREVYHMEVEDE